MKRQIILIGFLLIFSGIGFSQDWKIAGNKISTPWAEKVDPLNPLPEYPRPQMVRPEWKNLNGLWDYAIAPADEAMPKTFQGKILVPFADRKSVV